MNSNDYQFGFEKLIVWKEARAFITKIYELTDNFPNKEKFGLSSQIQRAAVSVAANIAEGSSRFSRKDFARFLQISFGSLMEVLSHAYVALDRKYIGNDSLNMVRNCVRKLSFLINKLSKSL
ncbi:MAG: four helix bundle protein [Candidatus Marinimicrobia bacterium]|nr:four helix bundle protein [Candidatus Neomarinimicrobiota bacterium]